MSKETILCAAIWYNDEKEHASQPSNIKTGLVFCGHRHPNCVAIICDMFYPNWQTLEIEDFLRVTVLNNSHQGFLTSKNRFVDRYEGARIALESGQITELKYGKQLYSEDLY